MVAFRLTYPNLPYLYRPSCKSSTRRSCWRKAKGAAVEPWWWWIWIHRQLLCRHPFITHSRLSRIVVPVEEAMEEEGAEEVRFIRCSAASRPVSVPAMDTVKYEDIIIIMKQIFIQTEMKSRRKKEGRGGGGHGKNYQNTWYLKTSKKWYEEFPSTSTCWLSYQLYFYSLCLVLFRITGLEPYRLRKGRKTEEKQSNRTNLGMRMSMDVRLTTHRWLCMCVFYIKLCFFFPWSFCVCVFFLVFPLVSSNSLRRPFFFQMVFIESISRLLTG